MDFNGMHLLIVAITSLVSVILGFVLKNKRLQLDEFQEEFKRLQTRVDLLEKKNYELMMQIANLKAENAELKAENRLLHEQIRKLGGE